LKKTQEVLKSAGTVERIETIIKNHIFQIDPLLLVECEKIFIDKISGTVSDRPELKKTKLTPTKKTLWLYGDWIG
jgi:DNA invertase Pin-like site-specific DNA recombinase